MPRRCWTKITPPDPHIIKQRHNLVCEGAANCIFVDNSSALLQSYCVLLQWPLLHNDLTVWLKLSSTINACMISLTTLEWAGVRQAGWKWAAEMDNDESQAPHGSDSGVNKGHWSNNSFWMLTSHHVEYASETGCLSGLSMFPQH